MLVTDLRSKKVMLRDKISEQFFLTHDKKTVKGKW